jgi:hypothetical protein
MKFLGECFGIEIKDNGHDNNYKLLSVMVQNDEVWFNKEEFSSYWLDDLINVLTQAKNYINKEKLNEKK